VLTKLGQSVFCKELTEGGQVEVFEVLIHSGRFVDCGLMIVVGQSVQSEVLTEWTRFKLKCTEREWRFCTL